MRFGLVIQSNVSDGGAHNYENEFVRLFRERAALAGHETVIFSPKTRHSSGFGEGVLGYRTSPIRMALSHLRRHFALRVLLSLIGLGKSGLEMQAKRARVELAIFASPNHLSVDFLSIPMACTHWDFGHLDLPNAPETSLGGIWAWREELFRSTLARSVGVFVESNHTRERLTELYGLKEKDIFRVGLLPVVSEPSELRRGKPYFMYPSMFWPHKNHQTLLLAFEQFIERSGPVADLVFTGDGAFRSTIEKYVANLNCRHHVKFLGLVSKEDLAALIEKSLGVVMPSLIGPSNLPPLESAILGTPVAISDAHHMDDLIEGHYLVPALDEESWANALILLFEGKILPPKLRHVASDQEIDRFIARESRKALALRPSINFNGSGNAGAK